MFPNFEELYPKSFIPIGTNDRAAFMQACAESGDKLLLATHWFIALEGSPIREHSHVYHWRIVVYPAAMQTVFYFDFPRFVSPPLPSFHDASLLAKEIEAEMKVDAFLSKKQPHSLKIV